MEIKKIGYPIKRASYTKSLLSRLRAGRSGEAIGTRGGFSPRPDVIARARCSSPFGPFQRAAPLRAYALATFRSNPPHRSASLHFAHCLRRIMGRLLPAILLRQRTPFGNPCKAATHNTTRELVNGYGTIAARQMGSKDMQQHGSAATKDLPRKVKKMLNRKMLDGNFAEFNRQLAYKSAWANRSFVEVPGDTPTAQVCSRCGHEELVLARDLRPAWTCPECGAKHDRKANGAQNVLEAGKDILAKQEQSFVTKAKKSRTKKRAKQS